MILKSKKSKAAVTRIFVPSLVIAFFSTYIIESLTGIFLVDVAGSFFGSSSSVSIALTSQLVTISSIVSVFFALILGFLSIKYNHKNLLLIGCLAVILGIVGCYLAPNFLLMQVFYPIEGIGTVVISALAFALVGEYLVLEKRSKAIGWILAGGTSSAIISSLVINIFFSGAGNWRLYLLAYGLPIAVLSLIAVYFGLPSIANTHKKIVKHDYFKSFKQIFLKKSATGCLIGVMVRQACFAWVIVFSATFFRVEFGFSLASTALITLGGASVFLLSEIVGGALVNRVGRKRLLVVTLTISSPALLTIAFLSNLWIVLPMYWIGGFIYGLSFPATTSLILEQAPESRGTMMSMSTIFVTFGLGIGSAIGGLVLVLSGWTGLIVVFFLLQLISAAIFFFLTKDPCINE